MLIKSIRNNQLKESSMAPMKRRGGVSPHSSIIVQRDILYSLSLSPTMMLSSLRKTQTPV